MLPVVLSIVAGLIELVKQSHETGQPITRADINRVISERLTAEEENAALDPKEA